ncbi:ABC transporter ATP-binding protein [Variovorax sp. J2P1-59]|uniref:ABC transporter ATP-binding protein n=1 Tax=Variovorax flavidus TaxID=3053501 RepID=UPI00257530B8|nr:ABC transporter ATP-binding protein [Variovorax sp. J2P1-59]MDM0078687.1 ABC transporter ATP-binding protein [Variovorax sp. J2P1-59]
MTQRVLADAPAAEALLTLGGLGVDFPGHRAVHALDLHVAAGETVALVGESGCGKSTTALAVLRLLPAHARLSGSVRFAGRELLTLREREIVDLRGRDISMIFQEPMTSLNPLHTIGQQVAESLTLHLPLSKAAARARAIELLDLVKLPEPARRFDDHPHHLSGGQRQRVMIAMAVACKPKLLIADEPTTALDVTIQAQILRLIDDLRRELGMAVLLITHDLGVVAQWADRVAVMHGGRKLEEGPISRVFAAPRHAYTRGLLGASLHLAPELHYRDARLAEIRADDKGGFELVREPVRPQPALARHSDGPLLSIEDLHIAYPGRHGPVPAVEGVSLSIVAGETVGLVGESGCGKSSLSRAIVRLVEAQAGRVVLDGEDLLAVSGRALLPWRRRVQMIFQDPYSSLNPRHRVEDILHHALAIHGVRDRAERDRRIVAVLDDVGLEAQARSRYPHEFSGGQRQRIGIARALVLRPELVICDEPVSALDVSIQAQILNLMVDLKAVYGLAYLFISHDLSVVRYVADRVLVMNAGRIVEAGDPKAIWANPQHPYTRSLLAAAPAAPMATADLRLAA